MLTIAKENLQKEKPQVLFVGGTNKKRKVAFASKRGKGKKQVKTTSTRKDGDDKGTCFHYGVKEHCQAGLLLAFGVRWSPSLSHLFRRRLWS